MKKAKTYLAGLITAAITALLIINSSRAKAGAISGSELCGNVIIPSLLPIMILSSTLSKSRFCELINAAFAPITRKIFHLPTFSSSAIFFGMIGGYPTGAVLTKELYRDGLISESEARRIMHFNICPGIAFCVNAVGSLYNDRHKTGFAIFFICVFSSVAIAFFEGLLHKGDVQNFPGDKAAMNMSDAFCSSVRLTATSLLTMSCYIIFFSALCETVSIPSVFFPLFEITNGIFNSGKIPMFPYLCFFMSFSGFCIHMQIAGITHEFNMKYGELFLSRCVGGALAFFPGKAYALLHPETSEVFSNISYAVPKINSVSYGFSLILLLGCAVIVTEIKNKKSKLL